MPATFELSLPNEEPVGLVGPWEAGAPAPVSFVAGESAPLDAPVWKVSLPEDPFAAEQALSEAEAQIAAAEAALNEIPARLEAVTSAQPRGSQVSFEAAPHRIETDSPEASMLDLLGHARSLEQGRTVISYGMTDFASEAWEQARVQFEAFVGQIQREMLHFAWVETNVAGRVLARTTVGWSGDNNTAWLDGVAADQVAIHRRALQVAIKSRALRMRIFATVTGGAAKLSILLSTPAGAVLALPAAWKYVTDILAQIKSYQTLTQGGTNG